jgi:hypothetical protein
VVLGDRPSGYPNSGCWFVRNDAFGRRFLREWVALETVPWRNNDNGALAFLVLQTLAEARGCGGAGGGGAGSGGNGTASGAGGGAGGGRCGGFDLARHRGGALDYADYERGMRQLGSPYGARNHPHIRFLGIGQPSEEGEGGGAAGGGAAAAPRSFCTRWRGEAEAEAGTEAEAEAGAGAGAGTGAGAGVGGGLDGTGGGADGQTGSHQETTYRAGDFMVHDKWHMGEILGRIGEREWGG